MALLHLECFVQFGRSGVVVMIDSIRSVDGFGVSKCVDRRGPPAGQGARITITATEVLICRADLVTGFC